MTYTQNMSKKLLKNKNMCTIFFFIQTALSLSLSPPISYFDNAIAKNQTIFFFFLFLLFRQCHCHKPIVTIFFSLLFRQCYCHKFIPTIFPPSILAISLPQTNCNNFFSLLFRQFQCHKFIPTIFPPSISAMPLPQIHSHNYFFPLFQQCHCHKSIATFFFLRNDMCTPFLQQVLSDRLLLVIIIGLKK